MSCVRRLLLTSLFPALLLHGESEEGGWGREPRVYRRRLRRTEVTPRPGTTPLLGALEEARVPGRR